MRAAITPSPCAALLLALAAPLALLLAALRPDAWVIAPVLGAVLLVLVLADALLAPRCLDLRVIAPPHAEVGQPTDLTVLADFAGSAPRAPTAALALDPRVAAGGRFDLALAALDGAWSGTATVVPQRRGPGRIDGVWLRWTGPFGLGCRQVRQPLDLPLPVRPNVAPIRDPALQLLLRDARIGQVARRIRGEGIEFEALAEYEPGMDRRRIDWKVSARHSRLLAREYEAERNLPVVFAIDCGQAMCEPVDGIARIDRAVTAALTGAWVALKHGDRAALFAFAAKPLVSTPFEADSRGFHRLQSAAAGLDYHTQEPNFTLAMTTLAARLGRRSLVVLFTEFADPTGAELMLEAAARLIARHKVICVVMEDTQLAAYAAAPATDLAAVARAVTADALAQQRAQVLDRLRRLGARVVEAPWQVLGLRLVDAYLSAKREGAIG